MTPEMQQESMRFGQPLGEFKTGVGRILNLVFGVLLALVGVFFLVTAFSDLTNNGANIVWAIIAFVIAGVTFWRVFSSPTTTVRLYQGGFSITQRGQTTPTAWSDVNTITQAIVRQRYYGIPIYTSRRYNITLANGQVFKLNETIAKSEAMGEAFQTNITRALTPRALDSLRAGAVLPFGKLSLNPQGISNGKETLPWQAIQKIDISNGVVAVRVAGKMLAWNSFRANGTPNLYVFLSVIDNMRRSAPPMPPAYQ